MKRAGQASDQRLSFWAARGHRLSGVALSLFLPLHFLTLGLALEGAAALDGFLVYTDLMIVKIAEWGLVILLSIHLVFGLRVLVIEFAPWPKEGGLRLGWIMGGVAISLALGLVFVMQVV